MAEPFVLQDAKDLGGGALSPQTVFVSAATPLKPYQTDVRITTGASVAYNITMPAIGLVPVGTAFHFRVIADGGTGDVSVVEADGSTDILGDAFSALNDNAKIVQHGNVWKVEYETTT